MDKGRTAHGSVTAAAVLRRGGLVAVPTETVYGLSADATNAAAVARIFAVKGRPATNPLIVHVADAGAARRWASVWPAAADDLAARFWPGPLTIVLPKRDGLAEAVTAGGETVGIRVPDHPLTLEVLRRFGGPVAAPSANRSEHVSPTTAGHVRDDLGDAVDLILDGGPCRVGIESTVLSLAGDVPTVLRAGSVTVEALRRVLADVRVETGPDVDRSASPGRSPRHYAPDVPATRVEGGERFETPGRVVIARAADALPAGAAAVRLPDDPAGYARELYATLRRAEQSGTVGIVIVMPPAEPAWSALRDRIVRATAGAVR